MIIFLRIFIAAFLIIGAVGVGRELGGSFTDPLFWLVCIVLVLVLFVAVDMYQCLERQERAKIRNAFDEEDFQRRKQRLDVITHICNQRMQDAQGLNGLPIKSQVFITYEELLTIWDQADKITFNE